MFNFGFVLETVLGHITHYQNLKHWVEQDRTICPAWMPIADGKRDLWEWLPVVRANWSLQSSLRAHDAIRSALSAQPLDALFLHTQTAALFAIPFMRQIPTVISTDATPLNFDSVGVGYQHKVDGHALLERRKFLWTRSTYHAATALIAFSQWTKDSIVTDYGVAAEKVSIIPFSVDLEQWGFKEEQAASSTTARSIRLLFVGGDFARKGGYTLIEAFRSGLARSCTLDIVTKDPIAVQKLAGIEDVQVHANLAANSSLLKQLYAQADIFVFPTQADCFPYVLMEAMAAGLPIVATDIGAIREQVEVGVNGLLVPVADPGALATALRALVSDASKRHTMAIASRRLAEERFDGRRNYRKILTLMKNLTEERMPFNPSQSSVVSRSER